MAAPVAKTIKDLNGKWVQNKKLSGSPEEGLAVQGVGYLTRKAVGLASITMVITQYEGPAKTDKGEPGSDGPSFTHVDMEQQASGLVTIHERRCLDDHGREHSDWLFGNVTGRSRWGKLADLESEYLKSGWLVTGGDEDCFIISIAENKENGWTATQVWGFQEVGGERRFCRNVLIDNGKKKAEFRLVFDYDGDAKA